MRLLRVLCSSVGADLMSNSIRRVGELFEAKVSPPHGSAPWSTPHPMTAEQLDKKLYELGCHTFDISDAFDEADPNWLDRSSE